MTQASPSVLVGRFAVRTSKAEAAAFRALLGPVAGGDDGHIPLALPIRWLLSDHVQKALRSALADAGVQNSADKALVHLEQTLSLQTALYVETGYTLEVRLAKVAENDTTIQISAAILTAGGQSQANLAARLALVATLAQDQRRNGSSQ